MARPSERLLAIDWLRGLVMVLMAVDHVDHATNPNHAQGDGAMFPGAAEAAISAPDFTVRWLTHLCAPTFVLLAGVSVALSVANARDRGATHGQIDRHLVLRGGVIVLLELTLVSYYWRVAEGMGDGLWPLFPQVLWAIGGGIMLMPLLRRLRSGWLLAAGAALLIWSELTPTVRFDDPNSLLTTLFLTAGPWWAGGDANRWPCEIICLYPLLTWLPAMLLGLVLGRMFVAGRLTARLLVAAGLAGLLVFAVLRGLNGFGNLELYRRSHELLEWLHCSKYPPSITFLALELGLALLVLALLMKCERLLARLPDGNPIAVLGRVPLFYYLLHLPMIGGLIAVGLLPGRGEGSAAMSLLGTLAVVAACWPLCGAYAWYKGRYRHAWTRFL